MQKNQHNSVKTWVIVGGGTAGWMVATLLARLLRNTQATVTLVESLDINTIGVGEATVPSFVDFIQQLGISEQDFIKHTNATFKLGIKFSDWQTLGTDYWHPFGNVGARIDGQPLFSHWLKQHFMGSSIPYTNYAPSAIMAQQHKFYQPNPEQPNNLSRMGYALHFDAGLAADYLAKYGQQMGIRRVLSEVTQVNQHSDGRIQSLQCKNDETLQGDFFIDCSGQQALLLGQTLGVAYTDWQCYLPVNKAVVVQSEKSTDLPPYTQSVAHEHGWRWRIPLQNRTGNGYVYCDQFCTDEQATTLLLDQIQEKNITTPRIIGFNTGKRQKMWHKNCVAIGLSSGFLEPLESTSIYLAMRAALNLVKLLPNNQHCQATEDEYNRLMDIEYENIRDFIVLHYCTRAC